MIKIGATQKLFVQNTLFFGLEKIDSRKSRFFKNPNRLRFEILVKAKKVRLDVTISKKNPKKGIFSATI